MNRITLQYFNGCPNWETTDRILAALVAEGCDISVEYELIDTYQKAKEQGFSGSPTVLVDGVDPFADDGTAPGLACRVYQTETGPAGSPSIHQLRRVVAGREKGNFHGDQH